MTTEMNDEQFELTLQRLIDVELTMDERRAFLQSIGESSTYWKHVALAVLEQRVIERQVQTVGVRQPVAQVTLMPKRSMSQRFGWVMQACLLVIAFVGGWAMPWRHSDANQGQPVAKVVVPSEPVLADQGQPEPTFAQAPLSEDQEMDAVTDYWQQLYDQGYGVEAEQFVLAGQIDDARQIQIPVTTYTVSYRGQ